jgi:hypothetical protein
VRALVSAVSVALGDDLLRANCHRASEYAHHLTITSRLILKHTRVLLGTIDKKTRNYVVNVNVNNTLRYGTHVLANILDSLFVLCFIAIERFHVHLLRGEQCRR